ncbi:MAG TPA: cobalamin-binding protein [Longimicrobiales bacterium]|nr:cobalamin-binding protein [Longimicrobiales bacterium]
MFIREAIAATGRGRRAAWTAALALCALAAAGCAPGQGSPDDTAAGAAEAADPTPKPARSTAPAPSVVDDGGRAVSLAAPPRRIVSLIPAVTEMLIALGAGDRLVARTDYDTNPLLDTLPSVGGGLTPDIEWLVRRRPDLVIGWTDGTARTVLGRLRALGIGVYSADIQSLADADATVLRLGALLRLDDEAEALVARTRRGLDDVRDAARGLPRPRVLYVLSVDPPMTAGPGTFLHEIIELAGGTNVFGDAGAQWPTVSLEAVVDREPDLLLVPVGEEGFVPLDRLASLPGWTNLAAVRAGRVHPVDADRFHRPGPHLVDVARELMRIYYPGLEE